MSCSRAGADDRSVIVPGVKFLDATIPCRPLAKPPHHVATFVAICSLGKVDLGHMSSNHEIQCPICGKTIVSGSTGGWKNHWRLKHKDPMNPEAVCPKEPPPSSKAQCLLMLQDEDSVVEDNGDDGDGLADAGGSDDDDNVEEKSPETSALLEHFDWLQTSSPNCHPIDDIDTHEQICAMLDAEDEVDSENDEEAPTFPSHNLRHRNGGNDTPFPWSDHGVPHDGESDSNHCDDSVATGNDDQEFKEAFEDQLGSGVPVGSTFEIPVGDGCTNWPMNDITLQLLKLVDLLNHMGCPKCAFDEVMKWAREAEQVEGFSFLDKHPRRDSLMRRLHKDCKPPTLLVERVTLERVTDLDKEGLAITQVDAAKNVFLFDFKETLNDLFGDEELFGDTSNLCLNPDDIWHPHKLKEGEALGEIVTGLRHQRAAQMIKDPDKELLVPLVICMDKTGTDVLQRHNLEPVLFSLGFFTEKTRRQDRAWRPLGCVNDLSLKSRAQAAKERSGVQGLGGSLRNYHRILRAVLSSLKEAMEAPFETCVRIGNLVRKMNLRVCIIMIIGDMKSGDALAGKFGSHNLNSNRLHRACDCPAMLALDASRSCQFLKSRHLQDLADRCTDPTTGRLVVGTPDAKLARDELQRIQQHRLSNAFRDMNLGEDPNGMCNLQPVDVMHAFLKGILEKLLDTFFGFVTDTEKDLLDGISKRLAQGMMQHQRDEFPKTTFAHGISNLTLITAEEWAGVAFVLVLISRTEAGRKCMEPAVLRARKHFAIREQRKCEQEQAEKEAFISNAKLDKNDVAIPDNCFEEFVELLELTLCFQSWFLHGRLWAHDDLVTPERVHQRIGRFVSLLDKRMPRRDGHGWNIPKVHEFLHLVREIQLVGRTINAIASHGERMLKGNAKEVSTTAQKQGEQAFSGQSAANLQESMLLNKVFRVQGVPRAGATLGKAHPHSLGFHQQNAPESKDHFVHHKTPHFHGHFGDERDGDMVCGGSVVPLKHLRRKQKGGQTALPRSVEVFISAVFMGEDDEESFNHGHSVSPDDEEEGVLSKPMPPDIHGFTECIKGGARFRAHSNCRSVGEWHDWCMAKCETTEADTNATVKELDSDWKKAGRVFSRDLCPAKIIAFIATELPDDEGIPSPHSEVFAVVQTCQPKSGNSDSMVTERWELETIKTRPKDPVTGKRTTIHAPRHRLLPVEAMEERVLVFEETRGVPHAVHPTGFSPIVHLVHPRKGELGAWGDHFMEHDFNKNDQMEENPDRPPAKKGKPKGAKGSARGSRREGSKNQGKRNKKWTLVTLTP